MFVIIVVGQCFSVPESNAQVVFSGGGTFYIDYEINDNVLVRSDYGLTTVNVVAGGRIAEYMRAINNGRINVLGGEVDGVLYATSGPVTVSGGILKSRLYNHNYVEVSGGIVQDVLESYSHHTAIVSGGELRNGVLAYNESYVSISGGQILKVRAYDDSQVVITGGVFTDSWDEIIATHNGVITISGTGFNYDYGEIPVSSGTLTGTLDSGEQINNNFRIVHYGEGYDGAAIVLDHSTLLLLSPNGGETLVAGQTYRIDWSSTGSSIGNVLIEYSANSGQDWNHVSPPNVGNTGTYDWTVPAVSSQECLISIRDTDDSSVNDTSDSVFEIRECTLSVIKPNGGEAILKGTTYDINWLSNLPAGNVLIEYSANNGQDWESIVTTEDTGSYEWQIDGPQSNQYMVRVSDTEGWNVFDTSDSTFTVYTCQEEIAGDLNGDCVVNLVDFALVAQNWLEKGYVRISFSPLDTSPNWIMERQWEFGLPTGSGGNEYGNPDPSSGYTGTNVYGVNLNGDYSVAVGGPYCLTTGPFDCNKFHDMKLRFARWLNTDEPGYVASRIDVSNDGANWHTLWENTAAITDSNWQVVEYDVSGTADNEATVYFRWSYEILDDRAYPYSGWNIDDIELLGKF